MAIPTATVIPFVLPVYDQPSEAKTLEFLLLTEEGGPIHAQPRIEHRVDINTTSFNIIAQSGRTRICPAEHNHNDVSLKGQILMYVHDKYRHHSPTLESLGAGMRYIFMNMLYNGGHDRVEFFLHCSRAYPLLVAWITEIAARCAHDGDLGRLKANAQGWSRDVKVGRAAIDALEKRQDIFDHAVKCAMEEIPARAELIENAYKSS